MARGPNFWPPGGTINKFYEKQKAKTARSAFDLTGANADLVDRSSKQDFFGMRAGENGLNTVDLRKKLATAGQVEFAHHVVKNEDRVFARDLAENIHFGKF